MSLIHYTGSNSGSMTWVAPGTGTTYLFGGSRRQGWVDDRDVEWFLSRRENGGALFAIDSQDAEPVEMPPLAEPVVSDEEHIEAMEAHLALPDISQMTVAEVKALEGLTHEQWWQLHDLEAAGKNRVGVLTYIQDRLSG